MPLCFHCAMRLMIPTSFPKGFELHQQKCIVDLRNRVGKPPKLSVSFLSVMPNNRTAYKKSKNQKGDCVSPVAAEVMTLLLIGRIPNCTKSVFIHLFLLSPHPPTPPQLDKQAVNII